MRELVQDLWTVEADATVITTNGFVKRNGEAVMGRGCAREAADRVPGLQVELGALLKDRGNHVMDLKKVGMTVETDEVTRCWSTTLVSFPVKDNWFDGAEFYIIERSAYELVSMTNRFGWEKVVLPRPGCGNGRLEWDGADGVGSVLRTILDDRFTVVTQPAVRF